MRVSDFAFKLPDELIAHYPLAKRSHCRLLSLNGSTGELAHGIFTEIVDKLESGDLLVFNAHIDKGLLQRFVVIQQKGQHVIKSDTVFGAKGFLV